MKGTKKSNLYMASNEKLTLESNNNEKIVEVKKPRNIAVFFIGGAGDKRSFLGTGPNGNITAAKNDFDKKFKENPCVHRLVSVYLGYYEVYKDDRIKKNIIEPYLSDKSTIVYIVGHSLGGWNAAHLSNRLSNMGYRVYFLITLDPVGRNPLLAEIYDSDPKPIADFWINLRYEQDFFRMDFFPNLIADAGVQWPVESGADINLMIDVNHASTRAAMNYPVDANGTTSMKLLVDSVARNF